MRNHRFYCANAIKSNTEISLSVSNSQHISQVLRLRAGDKIILFDGSGPEYFSELTVVNKSKSRVKVGLANWPDSESNLKISLWHSLCRGARMDTVIQKATELGVKNIQPAITSRSVIRLNKNKAEKKMIHWRKIAISAAEQSGRCKIPQIKEPKKLVDLLYNDNSSPIKIIFDTEGTTTLSQLPKNTKELILLTGPEGGFTKEEIQVAEKNGFLRIRIGKRILRTETAPIAGLSILQFLFGDMNIINTRL
ncbi:MAG: 16S rRNA (uracil(1498)-N(3))-methyltransferase [Pseudomonadota bacterium]|nr:16S rRNA (uracil(1498)-N(3))-methyltransferase [Pseudomonadota bacterium]